MKKLLQRHCYEILNKITDEFTIQCISDKISITSFGVDTPVIDVPFITFEIKDYSLETLIVTLNSISFETGLGENGDIHCIIEFPYNAILQINYTSLPIFINMLNLQPDEKEEVDVSYKNLPIGEQRSIAAFKARQSNEKFFKIEENTTISGEPDAS